MKIESQEFYEDFQVRRACPPPCRRSDMSYWAAVVTGVGTGKFKLEMAFLPKTYPALYEKRPRPALDFSTVQPGDVVRHKGAASMKRNEEEYWLIESINDEGVRYRILDSKEVAGLYRGQRPDLPNLDPEHLPEEVR